MDAGFHRHDGPWRILSALLAGANGCSVLNAGSLVCFIRGDMARAESRAFPPAISLGFQGYKKSYQKNVNYVFLPI